MKRFGTIVLSLLLLSSCGAEKSRNLDIRSEADLSGLRVATITGSSYEMDLSKRDDISLTCYNATSDLLQALLTGKADVIVHDEVVFNPRIRKENGIKIAFLSERTSATALMFNKADSELAEACSKVQRRMFDDGSMQRLKDFWLEGEYFRTGELKHIPDEGTGEPLRVATCASSAPLSFYVDGEWYGIEMDLVRELGRELGRPLDIKYYDTGSCIMTLKTGIADVLCGCIFITPEREEQFCFAEPYHYYHPAYFVLDPDADKEQLSIWGWIKKSIQKTFITENRWKFITRGLWATLRITILAILLGSLLGALLYRMKISRHPIDRVIARLYNSFISGIPQLVLLLILFYIVFARSSVPPDLVAVIAFAMYFASSAASIYDTSLSAIPRGQTEAGLALGFTKVQTFMQIVLPQAIRQALPLFKGQCISLLKGTSIVGYIAINDLTRAGDLIRARTFDALVPLLLITILYFIMVWLIGILLNLLYPKKHVL